LFHRPVEQAAEDLAVAVRRLRRKSPALHLAGDERGDAGRRDLLEALRLNDKRTPAAVLPGLRWALLRGGGKLAARDLQRRADRAERVAQVVNVRLGAFRGLNDANVLNVRGDDVGDRRLRWKGLSSPRNLADSY
jgi:hypothetical protein